MFAEMWMERVAKTVGVPDWQVRRMHLYNEGDLTHFGQLLDNCQIRSCWERVVSTSQHAQRMTAVAAFNEKNRWRKRGIAGGWLHGCVVSSACMLA